MDEETREIMDLFIEESRSALDEVVPMLIELEVGASVDPSMVGAIFRLFHSMKGSAGFLGFHTIQRLTHKAEDTLDAVRTEKLVPDSELVDTLCKVTDLASDLLTFVEVNGVDEDAGLEARSEGLVVRMLEILTPPAPLAEPAYVPPPNVVVFTPAPPPERTHAPAEPEYVPPPNLIVFTPVAAPPRTEAPKTLAFNIILPPEDAPDEDDRPLDRIPLDLDEELVIAFIQEAEEHLHGAEHALLELEKDPTNPNNIAMAFRDVHSFKGNSGLMRFAELEGLTHSAETLMDQVQRGTHPLTPGIISVLLGTLDAAQQAMQSLPQFRPMVPKLIRRVEALEAVLTDPYAAVDEHGFVTKNDSPTLPPPRISPPPSFLAAVAKADVTPEIELLPKPEAVPEPPTPEPSTPALCTPKPSKIKLPAKKENLRVAVAKLDMLMDLIGELIIAETSVTHHPEVQGLKLDGFNKAAVRLNRITRDLQDVTMSLRMIPIGATFRRMIRLVRDVSRKQEKQVELHISGDDTEIDRTVIEVIADPLVHMMRNAVDHGLEDTESRIAAGKSSVGHVYLDARHQGGEVLIQIRDDGKGLHRDGLIKKAVNKGIITQAKADVMSDSEVFELIFAPGFSTATTVTDISGRGVGMDVVRRNIESVQGRVEVTSTLGKGTSFILRIPLTLAIIEGMLVRVGESCFTIPLLHIRESVVLRQNQVTTMSGGAELVNLRGSITPVVRLNRLYEIEGNAKSIEDGILIIVQDGNQQAGLLVDEILGQRQTVIKGLKGYLANIRGLTGCTILADGQISLILDITSLLSLASKRVA